PAFNLETDGLTSPGPGRPITMQLFYDALGRIVRSVDPLGRELRAEYGVPEQPLVTVDAAGKRFENTYHPNQKLGRRDAREIVRDPVSGAQTGEVVFSQTFEYDALDRLVATTDPLGNTTSFTSDSRGKLVSSTDPLGNTCRAERDIYGRTIAN